MHESCEWRQTSETAGQWKQYQPGDMREVPMHKHPDIAHSQLFMARRKPFIMFRRLYRRSGRYYLWRNRPDVMSDGPCVTRGSLYLRNDAFYTM